MTAKADIVAQLGEQVLLLPAMLARALAANDRIKLRLSLLQEAEAQARRPGRAPRDFSAELRACGLGEDIARAAAEARLLEADRIALPGVAALLEGLRADLDMMLAPLQAADESAAAPFLVRAAALQPHFASSRADEIPGAEIAALTRAAAAGADGFHPLVMDAHRALNRLAAQTASETIDGAYVNALLPQDREAVRAFMRGLNRTKDLAFGHPGLGTSAARAGDHLTIQNDIGTTDAHVLVIRVEAGAVTVTYTDIHRPRAKFFTDLFAGQGVAWSSLGERKAEHLAEASFLLVTGRFSSTDSAAVEKFLEFLGSRIVFLIDWNKARKALQNFVGKADAVRILDWAARNDFGHRAFVELGGSELVFEAVHRAAAGRIRYGARLDAALGEEACLQFLREVLRATSQGLAAGLSARLIRDEIQADLARHFESAEGAVFSILVRHLGLSLGLAEEIAQICAGPCPPADEWRKNFARRAKLVEAKADQMTNAAREAARRARNAVLLRPAIDEIENTADALEESAFLLGLLPATAALPAPLGQLAGTVATGINALIRAIQTAAYLPEGQRVDALRALEAIEAVQAAERAADAAERALASVLFAAPDQKAAELVLILQIARVLEDASDRLAHAAFSLRDRMLEELSA